MHSHRLLFTKDGPARYISHLDLMRTFPRGFQRACLAVTHTEGFHPHASISIALPLPIGSSSECELLDFTPAETVDPALLPERLNRALPEGIRVTSCHTEFAPLKNLRFVRYRLSFEYDHGVPPAAEETLRALFARETLPVPKKVKPDKKKAPVQTETDIRPMLHSLTVERTGDSQLVLDAVVCARDPGLNPAQLAVAVRKYCPDLAPDFVSCHRLALYDGEMNPFL